MSGVEFLVIFALGWLSGVLCTLAYLVFTAPSSEEDAEFHRWYDERRDDAA